MDKWTYQVKFIIKSTFKNHPSWPKCFINNKKHDDAKDTRDAQVTYKVTVKKEISKLSNIHCGTVMSKWNDLCKELE